MKDWKLPDIQHEMESPIKIPISQVGVQNVTTKFMVETKFGYFNETIAKVSMSTSLNETMKGISMSMLLRTLNKYLNLPLKHALIEAILREFRKAVETDSDDSYIKFEFLLPIMKKSPLSELHFPEFYNCSFEGRLTKEEFRFFQKVRIQYASYCPCSASLCADLKSKGEKGYPHAQRSYAEVLTEVDLPNIIWLEDIIDVVEKAVKNTPTPILRRVDEQEFARRAAENPMFVEDAIRYISQGLNNEKYIKDWIVKCTHEESIHTHEAIAINWKGIPNGFTGLYFL